MLKRGFARLCLYLTGWELEGDRSIPDKCILIAAPHTSNWDLFYLLAIGWTIDIQLSWLGKHTLFPWPVGGLMKRLGGVPVQRDRREDLVKQVAEVFRRSERLVLVVPPEGTRGYAQHWKSGFYHMAKEAQVPIVMGYLDYRRKRGGFGPKWHPQGNLRDEMNDVRVFYSDKIGKFPDWFGPIRLRDES